VPSGPVGYGYRSIERIVEACSRGFEDEGIIATPANSRHNERVIEAARKSILDGGREVTL
jgi:translation initiation factor 2B subunit (eIF-2B alpha/beta/delta family)